MTTGEKSTAEIFATKYMIQEEHREKPLQPENLALQMTVLTLPRGLTLSLLITSIQVCGCPCDSQRQPLVGNELWTASVLYNIFIRSPLMISLSL